MRIIWQIGTERSICLSIFLADRNDNDEKMRDIINIRQNVLKI